MAGRYDAPPQCRTGSVAMKNPDAGPIDRAIPALGANTESQLRTTRPSRRSDSHVTEAGGVVAVTVRPAIRLRLAAISSDLGFAAPRFYADTGQVLESGIDESVVFLDLASCSADPQFVRHLQALDSIAPRTPIVVFAPLLDRECELDALMVASREIRRCTLCVMTSSDFHRIEVWRNLWMHANRTALEETLRAEFLQAVQRTGRRVPAECLVLQLLNDASWAPATEFAAPIVRARCSPAEAERKAVWRLLRSAGQLPASWLALIFRVLWYVKLTDRGWTTAQIAHFVGLPSPRHLRLTFRRRFGVTLDQLAAVRYSNALRWAAALVTGSVLPVPGSSVRDLITPLVSTSANAPPGADSRVTPDACP